ncbi:SDR family oxidoreductase [Nonomuraea wenchangensis]|uniref:SDR family oxidoreductase n=1 Tax=Nonomuraea wenchangensis TaxID=568860 RepID=UPI00384DC0C7
MARCLVTGATGYIGGRLVPELLAAGHEVRCMARSPERLRDLPWRERTEVVKADAADASQVLAALEDIDVAYYLIHTMGGSRHFAHQDRQAAEVFATAARLAGVRRIVYLGGLAPRERLPVMTTPRWVASLTQPIAVRDVLRYLTAWASVPGEINRAFDIGGPDVLTYADMMREYAAVAGLPSRVIIPVRALTPRLSSLWVGLVTPVPSRIARPLVESLRNNAVCAEHDIAAHVPDPDGGLISFRDAVRLALKKIKEADVATRWSSASTPDAPSDPLPTDPGWAGGSLYIDRRAIRVRASPESLWQVIESIGGDNGWYSLPTAWRLRGLLDRLVGGVGLRRGRRDPNRLRVGDAIDFWRVEDVIPGRLLRLRAEMRLPGLAWLELSVSRSDAGTVYRQRAIFHPHGLAGHLYWWAVSPFHGLIFGRMPLNVAAAAARREVRRPGRS